MIFFKISKRFFASSGYRLMVPALPPALDTQLLEYMLDCGFDADITAQLHKDEHT